MAPQSKDNRGFIDFIILTNIVIGVELAIFVASLAFYHFCIFRKKLSREIERMRLQGQKLERIARGVPEPDELSPTQKSSLLEAEPTQKSDNDKLKKKRKITKKTKSTERKKEQRKKETKKKTIRKTSTNNLHNLRLSLENTQRDDYDMGSNEDPHVPPFNPLLTPPTQESLYDNEAAQHREKSPLGKEPSDPDQVRTASPNEHAVYSPRYSAKQEKLSEHVDDADMRTAREDLWPRENTTKF